MENIKKDRIVAYLRKAYNPNAIILHGSRSTGNERPGSDWDIFILFKETPELKRARAMIEGEDVEWKAIDIPIKTEDIIKTFSVYLQTGVVLWEEDNIGSELITRSKTVYEKGPNFTQKDIQEYKQFMEHKIVGMKDDIDTPYLFFRHLSMFVNNAVNLWFNILHNKFSKPLYLGMPIIKETNPEYYKLLLDLYSNISNEEKIKAADELRQKLFNQDK